MITESQRRIDALASALSTLQNQTNTASHLSTLIIQRSRYLNTLTSPASDASAKITQASQNLVQTMTKMREAREKFDTIQETEPHIKHLYEGAKELQALRRKIATELEKKKKTREQQASAARSRKQSLVSGFMPEEDPLHDGPGGKDDDDDDDLQTPLACTGSLTEQDVYTAADAMDLIRDAYVFFQQNKNWKSSPAALGGLERVYQQGVDGMCALTKSHLQSAGPPVRFKKVMGDVEMRHETPTQTRQRLSRALENRDLMKTVGEYEEFLPLDTRSVRELRAIMECLGGESAHSERCPPISDTDDGSLKTLYLSPNKVNRTEKYGNGFTNLTKKPLRTGFPHLNTYAEARKGVSFQSVDGYYRHLKNEHKKATGKGGSMGSGGDGGGSEMDAMARDAVRCLEHAMVVVAGEKTLYRCFVSPTSSHQHVDASKIPANYKTALLASYAHIVQSIVDRTLDIIETVFARNASVATPAPGPEDNPAIPKINVRNTASAAAAGLRILDGVRMLGPSLAKLCEMSEKGAAASKKSNEMMIAGSLCICIHRSTVKNTAKMLEHLAKAIEMDPVNGTDYRPPDARVAAVSSEVVRAIKLVSPFVSAYRSVTKRRALPWDEKIGEEAEDMDKFVKYLIHKCLNNLQLKSLKYADDQGLPEMMQAKAHLFVINNTFYLLEQFTYHQYGREENDDGDESYKLEKPWFKEKVGHLFEMEKKKYLANWEAINKNLTSVDSKELTYQKDQLLSLESGRLLKTRFSGFIEDFERTYNVHKQLTVIDPKLRDILHNDVRAAFAHRYKRFFEKYSRLQFSKKNMDTYLKYSPQRVDAMIEDLYATQ